MRKQIIKITFNSITDNNHQCLLYTRVHVHPHTFLQNKDDCLDFLFCDIWKNKTASLPNFKQDLYKLSENTEMCREGHVPVLWVNKRTILDCPFLHPIL